MKGSTVSSPEVFRIVLLSMDEEEQAKNRQEKCNTLVMEASQNNTRLLTVNTSSPMGEQVRIVKNPVHENLIVLV